MSVPFPSLGHDQRHFEFLVGGELLQRLTLVCSSKEHHYCFELCVQFCESVELGDQTGRVFGAALDECKDDGRRAIRSYVAHPGVLLVLAGRVDNDELGETLADLQSGLGFGRKRNGGQTGQQAEPGCNGRGASHGFHFLSLQGRVKIGRAHV